MPAIETDEQEEDIPQFEPTFKKEKEQVKKEEKKKEQVPPFASCLSRKYVQKMKGIKNPPPDVGQYKPKYYQSDKSPHQVWDMKRAYTNLTTSRLTPRIPNNLKELMEKPIPSRLKPRVTGLIDMTRQVDSKKQLAISVPQFNKFLSRKPFNKKLQFDNESYSNCLLTNVKHEKKGNQITHQEISPKKYYQALNLSRKSLSILANSTKISEQKRVA